MEDTSIREHKHIQTTKATFHSESYASLVKGGKPRFSVEPLVYITGVGYEKENTYAKENEFILGFIHYVEMKEMAGYEHTGKTSAEMKTFFGNLWGVDLD